MKSQNEEAITIYNILDKYRKNPSKLAFNSQFIIEKLTYFLENNKPITMVLPACHGKADSPSCVISSLPDMGEYIGINNFSSLCNEIKQQYPLGVKLYLVHEGHFYTHTPLVKSDESIDRYLTHIRKTLNQNHCIKSIALNNFFPSFESNNERRTYFFKNYAPDEAEFNRMIKQNEKYQTLYLAYKKIYSKYILPQKSPLESQRKIDKTAKNHALTQLKIYIGFSKLEKDYFKEPYIRLSALYKDPSISDQIAINYIPSQDHMATPAFYAVVRQTNGKYHFIKKNEALHKGHLLKYHQNYAYFQE